MSSGAVLVMAVVLGAANAYVGMTAGLTVAATFPAAVVAMAALRPFRGTILEENVARTSASVGEALVAGAERNRTPPPPVRMRAPIHS